MTPTEERDYFKWINSEEFARQIEEYDAKLEKVLAKVTEEIAAKRELQEIVWVRDVIRFRENVLVSRLIGSEDHPNRPSKIRVKPWMNKQMERLMDPETGNAIVQWLVKNGSADLNQIMEEGILEMHERGFSQKDHEQFVMLHGYSVSAGGGLSYFSPAMCRRADTIAEQMSDEQKATEES